jgi:uncharacterized LabA/DUF88 family protein
MTRNSRLAVFIDGANLHATAKALGFDIDFKKVLKLYKDDGLVRIGYYTAVFEDGEFSSIRPLVDWLDYNGFQVVTKPGKEYQDSQGRRKLKGNLDVEISVDALELAPHLDRIVLFSGDGDFKHLVAALQRKGIRVTVVSTIKTQPAMCADELRRQADEFVDLVELSSAISRVDTDRGPRRQRDGVPS